jgi:hypothetical protein
MVRPRMEGDSKIGAPGSLGTWHRSENFEPSLGHILSARRSAALLAHVLTRTLEMWHCMPCSVAAQESCVSA